MNAYAVAYAKHAKDAQSAFRIYREYCGDTPPPRVPGMDTVVRLAWRIECGRSIEEAAAREYIYRWHLAIKPPDQCLDTNTLDPCVSVFGTPHTVGL